MANERFVSLLSDHIINKVHEFEEFYLEDAISGFDYKKHNIELTGAQIVMLSHNNSEDTLKYILAKGIIETGKDTRKYKLTPFGREVKIQGGYDRYIAFIKKRNQAFLDAPKWAKWATISAIATLIITLFVLLKDCSGNHIYPKNLQTDTINKAKIKTEFNSKR